MANKSNGNQQQQITPDQAVAMMQYAYPGQREGWYDIFRQNPQLAMGANFGGRPEGSQGSMIGGQSTTDLYNMLRTFNPQQAPQQAPQQMQTPQLAPAQPMPQAPPITPLTAAAQYGTAAQQGPAMNVPQANAAAAAPAFSLGAGQNWMLPQAQANPNQQQWGVPWGVRGYQAGGLVTPQPQQQMTDPWTGQPITGEQAGWANLGLYEAYPQGSTQANAMQQMGSPIQAGAQYAPYFLGAAALQMPPVINLPPSGTPSAKSGVAPTPGAIIGTGPPQVPQGPWLDPRFGSVFARAPMPTVGQPTGWNLTPGVTPAGTAPTGPAYGTARMPLTPQTPANAAQMPQMTITPAANAAAAAPQMMLAPGMQPPPAAPGGMPAQMPGGMQGITPHFIAAHTSALANAGMALYAHYGGDPNSAGPADIANFHSQLTGILGQLPQAATPGPAAAGANVALATGPAPARKMQSGGRVPGRGNTDTVPALLTPGEYVIPKDQVQQLGLDRAGARLAPARGPLRMQSGGTVPDDQEPAETRRAKIAVPAAQTTAAANQPSDATGTNQPSTASSGTTPAGISVPAATPTAAPAAPAAPSIGTLAGEQAYVTGEPVSGIAGGGISRGQISSAVNALGSGLARAAQTYADSIKPWQPQKSAIPAPPPAPAAPKLAQEQVQQPQQRQQANPYLAGMYGYPYA